MDRYDPTVLEPKWQRVWEETGLYTVDVHHAPRPFYNLMEFPYPSGEGLHVGHVYTYCGADTYGRFQRMQGYDVFQPMGFDSFGIHTENYALKLGQNPMTLTEQTVRRFRETEQWFFRITAYADRLVDGLRDLDWPELSKVLQSEWIGRSEGAEITFKVTDTAHSFDVFTTRPDTLFGATYAVLAPEHPLVGAITTPEQRAAVDAYVAEVRNKTERERVAEDVREKTGVFTGSYALNPATREKIPIWVADYVLMTYGTGAIMAVPAHDQRDFEFARKFGLEVRPVFGEGGVAPDPDSMTEARLHGGKMVNSGRFDGTPDGPEAVQAVTAWLEEKGLGQARTN